MVDRTGTQATAPAIELETLPGNAIRRLQQIAVAIFLQEAEPHGVTPVQYAVLQALANQPGGFDTSTIASVGDRLEARARVQRRLAALAHRRRPCLAGGRAAGDAACPGAHAGAVAAASAGRIHAHAAGTGRGQQR
jgi:hypothetical protein